MVSNHLESTWSNPVRNNRAQKYSFYSKWTNVLLLFCSFNADCTFRLLEKNCFIKEKQSV
ncbi:hypothetical protein DW940_01625 [Bacteroides uniformis]|uniref:Uncharacterized protein n=1 Tax=Bacteroides uniformis TaxID=820 RepID=A0A3E4RK63_BACUN|nr:hypothetical protein GAS34_13885 [Bacteroides uniformis]RGN82971.1 hypothetical protein DXB40_11320 [Bacteroides sp. 4_1_36]RJU16442.1 hypothetical protein DW039_03885 [Bacteroides sp. AF39-16AC]RJU19810.1 hypothetical protein DW012_15635 [Bacteroides sp. AF37-16AC]RJU40420.1 hypothetical protein DW896_17800 [Bacteroides sp. AM41-16]RJU41402.1 hypothetical protein DW800_16725 [Bacteroides sp. AM32-11AC]RJV04154.1 hypothetical protein DWZ67_14160 [Bacteroides sp. AF34-31BH]RJV23011.1 hypot